MDFDGRNPAIRRARSPRSLRPPPKPATPSIAAQFEEDEPTTRMDTTALLEACAQELPPPIAQALTPAAPQAAPAPPLIVPSRANVPEASLPVARQPLPAAPSASSLRRYGKVGAGIFAAGILVGGLGVAAILGNRTASVTPASVAIVSTAAAKALPSSPAALAAVASSMPPAAAAPRPAPTENAAEPPTPTPLAARVEPASDLALTKAAKGAPTCQELLGDALVQPQNAVAAARETQLGNRQLLLGNVAMAQAAYCHAFTLDRNNVDRHINLGRLYLIRRDWRKAEELARSGLALDPSNRRALAILGDALAALDQPDEARSALLAAEGKADPSERVRRRISQRDLALANRVARLNDFSLAERLYRRVLVLDSHEHAAMKGLASCLLKVGEYQTAATWARRSHQLEHAR